MAVRSNKALVDELPDLLTARGLSLRALARSAQVDPAHLSRILRREGYKTPSGAVAGRIAEALDLPSDYWPEYRASVVVGQVRSNPSYRDALYDDLLKRGIPDS